MRASTKHFGFPIDPKAKGYRVPQEGGRRRLEDGVKLGAENLLFMNKFRKLGFIEYNGKLEVHNSLLNVVLYDKPEIKTRDASTST